MIPRPCSTAARACSSRLALGLVGDGAVNVGGRKKTSSYSVLAKRKWHVFAIATEFDTDSAEFVEFTGHGSDKGIVVTSLGKTENDNDSAHEARHDDQRE